MTTNVLAPAPVKPLERAKPAAATKASRPARFYRPELDVLRCLALCLVFSSHVLPFPHGATQGFHLLYAVQEGVSGGVPLFFILTSFLITELLLREHDATGTVHIGSFYVRRILRIWPLYFLALGLAFLLPHFIHRFDDIGPYIAPFVLLGGNWVIVVHGWFHNPMLTPLWSTPVQEQFYLLWPLLYAWRGRRALVWASAALLPLAWITVYSLPAMGYSRSPDLWCNSLNQFQFFALGSLLAITLHRRPFHLSTTARWILFLAGAALFFLSGTPFHFINDFEPVSATQTLLGYLCLDAGCLCLCLAFLGAHMPASAKPLIYLGKISFGMYIFHYSVLSFVGAAIKQKLHMAAPIQLAATYITTALVSIAIASLSYHYFESPFLRLKSRFTFIRSRPA